MNDTLDEQLNIGDCVIHLSKRKIGIIMSIDDRSIKAFFPRFKRYFKSRKKAPKLIWNYKTQSYNTESLIDYCLKAKYQLTYGSFTVTNYRNRRGNTSLSSVLKLTEAQLLAQAKKRLNSMPWLPSHSIPQELVIYFDNIKEKMQAAAYEELVRVTAFVKEAKHTNIPKNKLFVSLSEADIEKVEKVLT